LAQNIKLTEAATGIGTENAQEPRFPLADEESAKVMAIIEKALKNRPNIN
jgi:4-hydroxy-tetrahydrodipicolinate synthase